MRLRAADLATAEDYARAGGGVGEFRNPPSAPRTPHPIASLCLRHDDETTHQAGAQRQKALRNPGAIHRSSTAVRQL